jgi:SpoVK/Ycf46/Vps4 family AAA+-type ATPase
LSCDKTWFVTSLGMNARQTDTIERKEISFSTGSHYRFKSEYKVPIIKDLQEIKYYIYPKFIVKTSGYADFEQIPLETIDIKFHSKRFIEDLSHEIHIAQLLNEPFNYTKNLPKDTKIVDYQFQYTNKDGSPNLRHSFNPKLPIVEYGKIEIEPLWLNYYFSNAEVANQFVQSFNYLKDKASEQEIEANQISQEFFNDVNICVNKLLEIYHFFEGNKKFLSLLRKFNLSSETKKNEDLLQDIFMIDIITCFVKFNQNIDLDSKYGFGLLLLNVKISTDDNITQPQQLDIYKQSTQKLLEIYINMRNLFATAFPDIDLFIPNLLNEYPEMRSKYLITLHRFASIAAKADNQISEAEQKWLSELLKMSEATDTKSEKPKIKSFSKSDIQTELNTLIGLNSVKKEISTLTNFLKIQKQREEKGLKASQLSYHCVFTGNPGTGKTTVARIVAEIYKELGILQKGHLVETDRSGLVAEYVGQTAVKTNKIIDSALNGVLFIDEAYSLVGGGESDYGKEAIATLLKRMEDNRDRLVVILAGYTTEMQDFINSNSGLQSRFNRYIDFPDYSAEELYQIFELNLKKFDYTISEEATEKLKKYFENIVTKEDTNFGNARFVRNFFEKTLERQANRLSSETNLTTKKLAEICEEDIVHKNH